jgi:hypothetical protein
MLMAGISARVLHLVVRVLAKAGSFVDLPHGEAVKETLRIGFVMVGLIPRLKPWAQ